MKDEPARGCLLSQLPPALPSAGKTFSQPYALRDLAIVKACCHELASGHVKSFVGYICIQLYIYAVRKGRLA